MLKGSSALALPALCSRRPACWRRRRPPTAITPALIEAAKKEGKVVYYTVDRPAGGRADRQGLRGEVPRRRGAGRAHRRRARVPAHRPGIRQPIHRGRRGQLVRRRAFHRLEARRHPRALRAGGRRQALSRPSTRTRTALFASFRAGLKRRSATTPTGEGGRRAEELRRPARSEMDRQDRQGASGLQRQRS